MNELIYRTCNNNHLPFTARKCPECHREAAQRYRDRHRQPKGRIIRFEYETIRWDVNPSLIPDEVKKEACIVPVHDDGTIAGRNGNGYSYIWINGKYYLLWHLLYFTIKRQAPPPYVLHWCSRNFCVNLSHLHHPTPRIGQTYRRKEVQGTINKNFPFPLKDWLNFHEKGLFKQSQPVPTQWSYLEGVIEAYQRVEDSGMPI